MSKPSIRTWDINFWWKKLRTIPGGRKFFSRVLGVVVPYTGTIKADIEIIRDGIAVVALKKRRAVCNHFGTVHMAALINLIELTGSLALLSREDQEFDCMLKSVEKISFKRLARGDVIASCNTKEIKLEKDTSAEVKVWCGNEVVATGQITWRITPKKTNPNRKMYND